MSFPAVATSGSTGRHADRRNFGSCRERSMPPRSKLHPRNTESASSASSEPIKVSSGGGHGLDAPARCGSQRRFRQQIQPRAGKADDRDDRKNLAVGVEMVVEAPGQIRTDRAERSAERRGDAEQGWIHLRAVVIAQDGAQSYERHAKT